jgi:hypothetical protein
MTKYYDEETEKQMRLVYQQLSEKDRRLYAAIETRKLPRGGQCYIAQVLRCARKTIRRGLGELRQPESLPEPGRIRHPGGGRKRTLAQQPALATQFEAVLVEHTAGSPMKAELRWTYLSPSQISAYMERAGNAASSYIVKQLLKQQHYVQRKAQKRLATGQCAGRDAQFKLIRALCADYRGLGYPIISIDTKKKEALGNLYREGRLYTREEIQVWDHDYPHLAEGVIIPYTIYDLLRNHAYVYLGTSKDTAEFVGDCLRHWWRHYGLRYYPQAPAILALADSGGSNSYRHYIFKQELQNVVDDLGIEIRMAHYPSYCSKWNPVEHRVFPHITRALQGVIFTSYALVKQVIETTTTKTGLQVTAHLVDKVYATGKRVTDDFKATMRIVFNDLLGKWNYRAIPT